MSDLDAKTYRPRELVVMINGIKEEGFQDVEDAINSKFDKDRVTRDKNLYGGSITQFNETNDSTITLKTNLLSDTFKRLIIYMNTQTLLTVLITIPDQITITITQAAVSSPGDIRIGSRVSTQEVVIKGDMTIVPVGI